MSDILRTPEERFNELPGFPYAPNYVDDLNGYEIVCYKFDGITKYKDFLKIGNPLYKVFYKNLSKLDTKSKKMSNVQSLELSRGIEDSFKLSISEFINVIENHGLGVNGQGSRDLDHLLIGNRQVAHAGLGIETDL